MCLVYTETIDILTPTQAVSHSCSMRQLRGLCSAAHGLVTMTALHASHWTYLDTYQCNVTHAHAFKELTITGVV